MTTPVAAVLIKDGVLGSFKRQQIVVGPCLKLGQGLLSLCANVRRSVSTTVLPLISSPPGVLAWDKSIPGPSNILPITLSVLSSF